MESPFTNITSPGNFSDKTIGTIISEFLPYVFGAAGIILLFTIISSGFSMMTSKGDPKAMQTAQGKLTTAIVGIIILMASYWTYTLILQFLGIEFNQSQSPNPWPFPNRR